MDKLYPSSSDSAASRHPILRVLRGGRWKQDSLIVAVLSRLTSALLNAVLPFTLALLQQIGSMIRSNQPLSKCLRTTDSCSHRMVYCGSVRRCCVQTRGNPPDSTPVVREAVCYRYPPRRRPNVAFGKRMMHTPKTCLSV